MVDKRDVGDEPVVQNIIYGASVVPATVANLAHTVDVRDAEGGIRFVRFSRFRHAVG